MCRGPVKIRITDCSRGVGPASVGVLNPAALSHLRRSNRLAGEKSPYLLQHARQPVDWYPWGPGAFEKARSRQVPIFLSVGYSTCHWCHVMARESFDDEGVAALLNNDFVCVKVDREERPDVDRVYMTYVQATTGHGGWPMSVWLTPDLDPFYGGTYFPPSGGPGVPGFIDVLQSITRAWNESRQRILEQGARITRELASLVRPTDPGALPPAEADLSEALAAMAAVFDPEEGGFGGPPKFPRPVTLNLLSRLAARFAPDSDQRRRAVAMLSQTLRRMASGGIRDHLGGGFHRYAVDGHWQVPHFEKMLYDQAQLVLAYADGFQLTHEPLWAEVVRETIAYVERDLMTPEGACYSAEDADSSLEHGSAEHGEGAFYVWTLSEVVDVVGTEFSPIVEYLYGLDRQGNVPASLDLHGELAGRNILALRRTLIEAAARFGLGESAVVRLLKDAKARLLAARGKRPRPHRDEKILAGWNGLMLSAWARAAQVLGDPSHTAAAGRCAAFLEENLWEPRGGLRRVYSAGGAGPTRAFAEDYAYLVQGLIDLYETSFDVRWLQWALSLQEEMIAGFWDADGAGFFQARARDEHLIVRLKEDYDGAEPAANSIAALNLLRLAALLDRADFREKAEATLLHFAQAWRETPLALPQMLVAADFAMGPVRQVVIAGDPQKPDTHQLIRTAHGAFLPRRVVALADGGVGQAWLGERVPAIAEMRPLPTGPAAYVCEGYVCQTPTSSPVALRGLLGVIA